MQANVNALIKKVLLQVPLLNRLPPNAMDELTRLTCVARYQKGEVIFDKANSNRVFLVVSGKVKIHSKTAGDNNNEQNQNGDNICKELGEKSIFEDNSQVYSVSAAEDTLVFYFDRNKFLDIIKVDSETMSGVLKALNINAGQKFNPVDNNEKQQQNQEWFFSRTFTCPLCGKETTMLVPRSKYVQVKKTDADLCTHFRMVDPTFYYIIICSHCGFAFPQDGPSNLPASVMTDLKNQLPALPTSANFNGIRSIDQAIATYRLAVNCQTLAGTKDSMLGRLNLRLGCLYRKKKMPVEERECLERALKHFEQAFTREHINELQAELNMAYVIGELNGRLGNIKEAIQWFNYVTTHRKGHYYRYIVNRARERWQDFKKSTN